jgi:hypothetical protein
MWTKGNVEYGKPSSLEAHAVIITKHSSDGPCVSCAQLKVERGIIIEEVDDSHCRQRLEGQVETKLFGIGKLAQSMVIDSTVQTMEALPQITERPVPAPTLAHKQLRIQQ